MPLSHGSLKMVNCFAHRGPQSWQRSK